MSGTEKINWEERFRALERDVAQLKKDAYQRGRDVDIGQPDIRASGRTARLILVDTDTGDRYWVTIKAASLQINLL